ncbi:hypothetical protein KJ596_04370 [Patescibacteria group bacterium]|nr:hypothetical protein [Patescibacteria group bacterium]MBU1868319.1 hypothetical protein [Patescibacteria group bacterium]
MEIKKSGIEVTDSRKSPDANQAENISEQIETDSIIDSLQDAKNFLGKYSTKSPQELSVKIVEGILGEGTVKGTQIEIQMPSQTEAIRGLQESLEPNFGEVSEQESDELVLASATSTVLHEGVHGILDSTPTSQLAVDYERVSGTPNTNEDVVALLGEGIAYAIQGCYAREVQPIGSLAPRINEQDSPEVKKRKALGEKLKPKVNEYIDAGKEIDDEFLAFASQQIKCLENL